MGNNIEDAWAKLKYAGREVIGTYVEQALRTESDPLAALERLQNVQVVRLLHSILGKVSEAGEIADTLKKHIFYGQDLDTENLKEEYGDGQWYDAIGVNALGYSSFDTIQIANIAKLRTRYPEKFSSEQAAEENRNRDAEKETLTSFTDDTPQATPVNPDLLPDQIE